MRVKKLVKEFIAYTRTHRKPSTLRHYKGRLKLFKRLYGRKKITKINPRLIERYLRKANRWKDGRSKAQDTCRSNVVVLQTAFRWAHLPA